MEKAAAINLVLLGGGLSLVGATMTLHDHNRRIACERAHPGNTGVCESHGGGHGGGGGGFHGGFSSSRGIARGGFGGFGHGFGGGE